MRRVFASFVPCLLSRSAPSGLPRAGGTVGRRRFAGWRSPSPSRRPIGASVGRLLLVLGPKLITGQNQKQLEPLGFCATINRTEPTVSCAESDAVYSNT